MAIGLYWFLSGDGVRIALEREATKWLGQPVTIGSAGARIFPRPAITLRGVRAGEPVRILLADVQVSTGLKPLWSRRIEDAEVAVSDSRIDMPLPFTLPATRWKSRGTFDNGRLADRIGPRNHAAERHACEPGSANHRLCALVAVERAFESRTLHGRGGNDIARSERPRADLAETRRAAAGEGWPRRRRRPHRARRCVRAALAENGHLSIRSAARPYRRAHQL